MSLLFIPGRSLLLRKWASFVLWAFLFSGVAALAAPVTVQITSSSPTTIPFTVHAGDRVVIQALISSSDSADGTEGENLVIQSSGGFSANIPPDGLTRSLSYVATRDGETFSAYVINYDSDESATVTLDLAAKSSQGILVVNANPSNGGTTTGSGAFTPATSRQISATASSGWEFTQWHDGSKVNPRTVTVPAAGATTTYTAVFQQRGKITVSFKYGSDAQAVYFLDGVSLNVPFQASSSDPRWTSFEWSLNDGSWQALGGNPSFDVGIEFGVGGTLKTRGVSEDGTQHSDPYTVNFSVIPVPPGVSPSGLTVGGDSQSLTYTHDGIEFGPGYVGTKDVGVDISTGDLIPFLSHLPFDLSPSFVSDITIYGNGFAVGQGIKVSKDGGFEFGKLKAPLDFSASGDLTAAINWTYSPGSASWRAGGSVLYSISADLSYTTYFDYWPPVYGTATLGVQASGELDISNGGAGLAFGGSISIGPSLKGALGLGVSGILNVEGYLKGEGAFNASWNPQPKTDSLSITLSGGVTVTALIFHYKHEAFTYTWLWDVGGPAPSLQPMVAGALSHDTLADSSNWQMMPRSPTNLAPASDQPAPAPASPSFSNATGEAIIQQNCFPQSQPAMAAAGGVPVLFSIVDDPNRSSANRTELRWQTLGANWSNSVALNDDGTGDFSPTVAALPSGQLLVGWQNTSTELLDTAVLSDALAVQEISAATLDPVAGTTAVVSLTNNNVLDHSPTIATSGTDGAFMAWINNPSNDLTGTAATPNQICSAFYSQGAWQPYTVVAANLGAITQIRAGYINGSPTIIFCRDMDDDLSTATDQEIYSVQFAGAAWGNPQALTNDNLQDSYPDIVPMGNNQQLVIWLHDGQLWGGSDLNLANGSAVPTQGLQGFNEITTCVDTLGQIYVVSRGIPDGANPGIHVLQRDVAGTWSSPLSIATDATYKRSIACTTDGTGNLVLAYNKVQQSTDADGNPTAGEVDFAAYQLLAAADLTVNALQANPGQPAVGDSVQFDATVSNLGLTATAPTTVSLVFRDGVNPDVPLGSASLAALAPGAQTTVSLTWTAAAAATGAQIVAIVDPANTVAEASEANNAFSIQPFVADLALSTLSFQTFGAGLQQASVTIQNIGLADVPAGVTLTAFLGSSSGTVLATKTLSEALPAGGTVQEFLQWNAGSVTGTASFDTIHVVIDPGNTVVEYREDNNNAGGTTPTSSALSATYATGAEIPVTSSSFDATGLTANFSLSYAPVTGTSLTVVNNTGLGFIQGAFSNLAQGQVVALSYNGITYNFVANYYGGTGNDLVLQWASSRLLAWGSNSSGQLGNNGTTQSAVPVAVTSSGVLSGKTVLTVSAGASHSLALCSDGTVAAWGDNLYGQLGSSSPAQSSVPVAVDTSGVLSGKTVVAVAAGTSHSVALCSDGTVVTWGGNSSGQLGNNSTTQSSVPVAVDTSGVLSGRTVVAVAAGAIHNLALCSDGTVVTWGSNSNGQLGNNSTTQSMVPVVVDASGVLSGRTVAALTAGEYHSLALCADGTLAAWGGNSNGQLGNGSTTSSSVPVAVNTSGVLSGRTVVAVVAAAIHNLALCSDGTLAAWGYNSNGQLGNNSTTQSSVPVWVSMSNTAVAVSAGAVHSLALCSDGTVMTWGLNTSGQLGSNSLAQSTVPVAVNTSALVAGERFMLAASGQSASHSLGLVAGQIVPQIVVEQPAGTSLGNGGLVDFGSTSAGAGVTQSFTITNTGTAPLTLAGVGIDGADAADFVLTTPPAGTVAAGAGTTLEVTFTPSAGAGLFRSAALHLSSNASNVAVFSVSLTGRTPGVLTASYTSGADVPLTVGALTASGGTVAVTLNYGPVAGTDLTLVNNTGLGFIRGTFSNLSQGQSVALSYGGAVYNFVANYYGGTGNDLVLQWAGKRPLAWGSNSNGQLGNGTQSSLPVAVISTGALSGKTVIATAAGTAFSLALCADGTLAAWGDNAEGELGTGNTSQSYIPVAVNAAGLLAGKTVIAAAAGGYHSLALCSDGTLVAWGYNGYGQLGNNSTANSTVPVAVSRTGALAGRTVVAVAAGQYHSLALCSDGTVVAWGFNADGELGNGTTAQSNVPVAVSTVGLLAGRTVIAVSAGASHSLALCSDGTCASWGNNSNGQLGNGSTTSSSVPVAVDTSGVLSGRTLSAIVAGLTHNLALCSDGTVAAWGFNADGELGTGATTQSNVPVAVSTAGVLSGRTVVALAAGRSHSLALCSDGTLTAWGYNGSGQLGNGSTTASTVPVAVSASALAAGECFVLPASGQCASHSLVLAANGPLLVVEQPAGTGLGVNATADLGSSAIGSQVTKTFTLRNSGAVPLSIAGTSIDGANAGDFAVSAAPASTVAAGDSTTLQVTFMPQAGAGMLRIAVLHVASNGTAPALGDFSLSLRGTAQGVLTASYSTGAETPLTGDSFTATGSTVALSLNYAPQTGTNLMLVSNTGLRFIQGEFDNLAQGQVVALSYGALTYKFVANYHGGTGNDLVLQWASNRLLAWGSNSNGQLGNGSTSSSSVPVAVSTSGALAGKILIATTMGSYHSLGLCADGTLAAWGQNSSGQLGNGSTTSSSVPVAVSSAGALAGKTVLAVSAGSYHSLALCTDGTVAAWGNNDYGQLGNSSTTDSSLPVAVNMTGVLAGRTVVAVVAGGYHSLALCSDGTVVAWGYNYYGQLGNNSTTNSSVPVAVSTAGALAGRTIIDVAAGYSHNVALCSDGTLVAWGYNGYGQLGNNSTTQSTVPVMVNMAGVLAGKTVTGVASGFQHCLALCSDGTLAAWGYNNYGQLGNNSTTQSSVPVLVDASGVLAGMTPVAAVAEGFYSLALCSDGTLTSWGYNSDGELGNSSTTQSTVPVAVSTSTLKTGERFTQIGSAEGGYHTLALVAQPPVPQIVVEQPAGTGLPSGSTVDFGSTTVGTGVTQSFTLRNAGGAPLNITSVSIDGANAADFVVTTPPASSLAVGASTTLVVTFTPMAVFEGSGALHIASDDPDVGVFNVSLSGSSPGVLNASYSTGAEVPLTEGGFTAAGSTVNINLNYAPLTGTNLMVVNNTGLRFIEGEFDNLAQGQVVALSYGALTYKFVANYHGGTGNDLVLQWAGGRLLAWGGNSSGQLGNGITSSSSVPVAVSSSGVLSGKTIMAVAGGGFHSLALCSDGTLASWGQNSSGQLGNGSNSDSIVPVTVSMNGALAGKTVIAVAAGSSHSLALCSDGTVAAWGYNGYGQLGSGSNSDSNVPVAVSMTGGLAGKTVIAVAAGYYHSLVLCSDGTVAGWGNNGNGQLGNSSLSSSNVPVLVNQAGVLAGRTVVAVTAGNSHSVALCSDGALAAWGLNGNGQLGNNTTTNSSVPVLVDASGVLAGKTVASVAAGYYHNLAVCTDGTVAAWGFNYNGQLGNGITASSSVPVVVDTSGVLAGKTVIAAVAGRFHSMCLCADGTVAAWGYNSSGQLGNGSTTDSGLPVTVNPGALAAGGRFVFLGCGSASYHNFALVALSPAPQIVVEQPAGTGLPSGSTVDFGSTTVGTGVTQSFTLRNAGGAPLSITSVSIDGANAADFVVTTPPANSLAVGASTTLVVTFTPMAVFEGFGTLHIASNDPQVGAFICHLTARCTGALTANYNTAADVGLTVGGLIATGSTANIALNFAPLPGTVLTVVNNTGQGFIQGEFSNLSQGQTVTLNYGGVGYPFVASYFGGTGNDLVLQWASSRTVSWGQNYFGQVGNGNSTTAQLPVAVNQTGVLAGKTVVSVAAGQSHSVALCSDGTVAAWGSNLNGQLGNGGTDSSNVPVLVDQTGVLAGKTVVAVAVGQYHSLAVCMDGTVAAWGLNNYGQLGNGTTTNSSVPVAVSTSGVLAGKTVMKISAGQYHSVAVCSDGTVAAWGYNFYGQLGNGSTTSSSVPVAVVVSGVLAGKTVASVAAGYYHSVAVCSDGTVATWGDNANGQLGNNNNVNSSVPVAVVTSGVLAGKTVVSVSAGYAHNLARCTDGTLAAWGYNGMGQLGNGSYTSSSVPVLVDQTGVLAGRTVVSCSAGYDHSLVACTDGTVAACGFGFYGQLGSSSGTSTLTAVDTSGVLAGRKVTVLAAGNQYSLALCQDGTLAAWGYANNGQLGDGRPLAPLVPVNVDQTGVLAGKTVVQMSAGQYHSLALCSDGTVASWGYNANGQLGNGGTNNSSVPVPVDQTGVLAGKTVVAVAAGYGHSMALCSDGTVAAWGYNGNSQLGNNSTISSSVPVAVNASGMLAGKTVVSVAAGYYHSLAICTDGTMAAWGYNGNGQLGNNSTTSSGVPVLVDASGVLAGKTVVSVAAGYGHSLAICTDGTVAAWGYNYYGQLGNNNTTNSSVPVLVDTSGLLAGKTASAVAAGYYHSLVLCTDGTLAAWGYNGSGQLGNSTTTNSSVPVLVNTAGLLSGRTVTSVAGGQFFSAALCSDGTLAAWGSNADGQLGNSSTTSSRVPVAVSTASLGLGERFMRLASGPAASHSLALVAQPPLTPVVLVEDSGGTTLVDGSAVVDFGIAAPATGVTRSLQIVNQGSAPLTVNAVTIDGANASDFVVTTAPAASVAVGASTTLVVTFTPSASLGRAATLHISSNDPYTGSYDIALSGSGALVLNKLFGSASDVGLTVGGLNASLGTANIALNYAPLPGTVLTVVNNTGQGFIQGQFSNLSQGQTVTLNYGGVGYPFVASYFGGTGNDLVLQWASSRTVSWGMNNLGQLGNGQTSLSQLPAGVDQTGVLAGKTAVAVAAGQYHSVALCSDGTVAAWGSNLNGQLGNGGTDSSNVPVAVDQTGVLAGKTVVAVAVGQYHSLALCSDGTVAAWGLNNYGQLGNNSTASSSVPVAVSTSGVLAGKNAVSVAGGQYHSLVLCSDGTLASWGFNNYGQLGNNSTTQSSVPVAVVASGVLAGKTATAISTGHYHSVALCSDGTLAAWGYNVYGQLGNNSTINSSVPVAVVTSGALAGRTVASVSAGYAHNLAKCTDGTLVAWGYNGQGQLGNGSYNNSSVPVLVDTSGALAGRTVASVSAGYEHSLVACTDGAVVAWGFGFYGQLGAGSSNSTNLPQLVDASGVLAGRKATVVAAGYEHSLALCQDGTLVAWGYANNGQLGGGQPLAPLVPVNVDQTGVLAGKTVVQMAAGQFHSLALCSDGTVAAWGYNSNGQLGNGSTTDSSVPVPVDQTGVLAGKTVVAVAAGYGHSLALCSDGTVAAWGYNYNGQLGNGSYTSSGVPVLVNAGGALAGKTVVSLAAGYYHSLAVCTDGTVAAWGYNYYGQLGNNSTSSSNTPVAVNTSGVLAGKTVVSVAAGQYHSVALCTDGIVSAWGYNSNGQLGNNTTTNSSVPVLADTSGVLAGRTVSAVAAGYYHSLVLCTDGTVAAWGYNYYGQLGNSTTTNSSVPVAVSTSGILAGRTVTSVAGGQYGSEALCSDGTVAAWGYGFYGQLGNGGTGNSSVPVAVSTAALGLNERFMLVASGSTASHSLALVAEPPVAPIIAVEQPAGTPLTSGSSVVDFGLSPVGTGVPLTFTITNSGSAPLTIAGVSIGGTNSSDFTVSSAPASSVAAGSSTQMTVLFTPAGFPVRTAVLHLASNDPYTGSFDISLSGSAPVALTAAYSAAGDVPLTVPGLNAAGSTVNFSLNYAPLPGASLTVVNNLGQGFIQGQFSNLSQGQAVDLSYRGTTYHFVASYFGGTGNDLVLRWADVHPVAWGRDNYGQLGNGTVSISPTPVAVDQTGVLAGKTVRQVAGGEYHSVALCSDGTLAAWGSNSNGQLGNGSTTDSRVPVLVDMTGVLAGKTVVAVAAGFFHNLALCSDGTVAAWGYNGNGQLGNGGTTNSSVPVAVSTAGVLSGKTITSLAAGAHHSLVLCSDGTVAAWGLNGNGQLGNGSTTNSSVPVALTTSGVLAGKTVSSVAAGYFHNLALCSDKTVVSWGLNTSGQLGNNSTTSSSVPVAVVASGVLAGKTVTRLTAGYFHSLVLCSDGTLAAWGNNGNGQFGNGVFTSSNLPVQVTQTGVLAGKTVVAVAAGFEHNLVLCSDGTAAAWGYNFYGQLGSGSIISTNLPVLVSQTGALAGKTVTSLAAGYNHGMAVCSDGTLAAWGSNENGQLGGNGASSSPDLLAVDVSGVLAGKTVISLVAGEYHSVALCSDGTLAAWGSNSNGQLGNGTTTDSSVPVAVDQTGVLAGRTVVALAAGYEHTVALCSDGTVAAWGYNGFGQLGNGSTTDSSVPVAVSTAGVLAGKMVTGITAGQYHSVALCSDGTVAAWGHNSNGELGNGSTSFSSVPVAVSTAGVLAGRTVVAVATGYEHNLALCSDGTLATWGYNTYGQLGNGTTTNSNVPVPVDVSGVLAGRTVTAVSAAYCHNVVLCSDGAVVAWGYNSNGQLGNGNTTSSSVPVAVSTSGVLSGRSITALTTGFYHTVAYCADGTVAAWGYNGYGQLGNGSYTSSLVPVLAATSPLAGGEHLVDASSGPLALHNLGLVAEPPVAPIIAVEQPAGTPLTSGSSVVDFGLSPVGTGVPLTFTITNSGSAPLTIAGVSIGGTNGSDFTVSSAPASSVAAGSSTQMTVLFTPAGFPVRTAVLHLASNDPYTGSFDISLSGSAPVALTAAYSAAGDVPLTVPSLNAAGSTVNFSLNYAPLPGASLTVVNNLGQGFIQGQFSNLSQGQAVDLSYRGTTYHFVASYFGGTGNDLVLRWADVHPVAWGRDNYGQLGNGQYSISRLPLGLDQTGVLAGKTVKQVAGGEYHSVALCTDGTLAAWGLNGNGQLGNGSTTNSSVPVLVDMTGVLAGKTVVAVAAGAYHSLALCSDGTAVAWGSNSNGQLGNGTTTDSSVPVLVDQTGVLAGRTVTALTAGYGHTLALCSDGSVTAWGYNFYGQLGNGSTNNSSVPVLVDPTGVLAGKTVASVSAGYNHSVAVCSDGTSAAWGSNSNGQLGNNSTTSSSVPVAVVTSGVLAGKTVTRLVAGGAHSVALCTDGTLAAWGLNGNGQLGNGSTTNSSVPVLVDQTGVLAGRTITRLVVGYLHTVVLCSDGTVAAWGLNFMGQLGNGSTTDSHAPALVDQTGVLAGRTIADLTAGYYHNMVVFSDGTVAAWGNNSNGQLGGNAGLDGPALLAVDVSGVLAGKTVISLVAGQYHSAALCSDGTLAAWGSNNNGQLGNGTTTDSSVPVAVDQTGVLAGRTVVALAAGYEHTVALCSDGTVAAWGYNLFGQLGDGSSNNSSVPVRVNLAGVLAGKTVIGVSAGQYHSVALCSDGTLAAWGHNGTGELGNGTSSSSSLPVLVDQTGVLAGKTVVAVTTGYEHNLALCSDGTAAAWGYNFYGQLGSGSTTTSSVPVMVNASGVLAGKTVISLVAGYAHSMALCSDGTLASWGYNNYGQLGSGSTTSSSVPVAVDVSGVLAGKTVTGLAAGYHHSMALCSGGTLAAWGYNSYGQLGAGSSNSSVPVLADTSSLAVGERLVYAVSGPLALHGLGLVAEPPAAPVIIVEQPAGTGLVSGGTVDFGSATVGTGVVQSFIIRNAGAAPLNVAAVTIDGANASDFAVTTAPAASVAVGASTTLVVTFTPSASLGRAAMLHISSNDPYTGSHDIALNGTGTSQIEAWRLQWFGTTSNTGAAADDATPQNDGVPNLMKFALGMDPSRPGTVSNAASIQAGQLLYTYTRSKAAMNEGLIFAVQWSDTLSPGSWKSTNVSEINVLDQGDTQRVTVSLPMGTGSRRFVHLVISGP